MMARALTGRGRACNGRERLDMLRVGCGEGGFRFWWGPMGCIGNPCLHHPLFEWVLPLIGGSSFDGVACTCWLISFCGGRPEGVFEVGIEIQGQWIVI
jgi:hypothetical protein